MSIGYSQFALRKLPSRNELVESGRYPLDKKIPIRFNALDACIADMFSSRQSDVSHYLLFWQGTSVPDRKQFIQFYVNTGETKSNHACQMCPHFFRCKICKRTLKWTFYADSKSLEQNAPCESATIHGSLIGSRRIRYFAYPDLSLLTPSQKSKDAAENMSYENPCSSFHDAEILREFIFFIADLPLGYGFSEARHSMQSQKSKQANLVLSPRLMSLQQSGGSYEDIRKEFLCFSGDFECANFRSVQWVNKSKSNGGGANSQEGTEVEVMLNSDSNTDGFAQWFMFRCDFNARNYSKIKLPYKLTVRIINCRKEYEHPTLAVCGLQTSFAAGVIAAQKSQSIAGGSSSLRWEIKDEEEGEIEFSEHPFGQIMYSSSNGKAGVEVKQKTYHVMQFSHTFKKESESIVFAASVPYSFSNLMEFIEKTENAIKQENFATVKVDFNIPNRVYSIETHLISYSKAIIGTSELGLSITEIEITSCRQKINALKFQKRPVVYIIGRQHPSDTQASFVIEGLIKFLLSSDAHAEELRSLFIFKIVPIVNPDGVMIGNSRTCLGGFDLNRSWATGANRKSIEISCIKERLQSLKGNLFSFIDVSCHSKKFGSQIITQAKEGNLQYINWVKSKLFAKICAENTRFIDLSRCKVISCTHLFIAHYHNFDDIFKQRLIFCIDFSLFSL